MEKKTALQQAIEKLKLVGTLHQLENNVTRSYANLDEIISILNEHLPTERQQLEDAWKAGNAARGNRGMRVDNATASDYYTTTYKTT